MIDSENTLVRFGFTVMLLLASTAVLATDRNTSKADLPRKKQAVITTAQPTPSKALDQLAPTQGGSLVAGVASPMAGEQIKWQVISGGGGASSSTGFKLVATVGQTATGPVASPNFKINEGFWQNFPVGSCCVGVTGNVNVSGIVDLADLSALVSYLTGGGYVLPCVAEANVNASGIVDLADLSALVSYLTGGGYVLPSCP